LKLPGMQVEGFYVLLYKEENFHRLLIVVYIYG